MPECVRIGAVLPDGCGPGKKRSGFSLEQIGIIVRKVSEKFTISILTYPGGDLV